MTTYSFSVLNALAECPKKGSDALGRRESFSGPSRQGQAGHLVFRDVGIHLMKAQVANDVDFSVAAVNRVVSKLSPEDDKGIRDDLMRWAHDFNAGFMLGGSDYRFEERRYLTMDRRPLSAEQLATISAPTFGYTPDAQWLSPGGKRLNLVDNKTGRVIEHVQAPTNNRQGHVYGAAAIAEYPDVEEVAFYIYHQRHRYLEGPAVYTREDMAFAWMEYVVAQCERWEKRIAEGNLDDVVLGAHCADCAIRNRCDEYKRFPLSMVVGHSITDADLIAAYAVLEAKMDDVKAEIKSRIDLVGDVKGPSHNATIAKTYTPDFNVAKLREHLANFLPEHMVDLAFSSSKTRLTDAFKAAKVSPKDRTKMIASLVDTCTTGVDVSTRLAISRNKHARPESGTPEEGDL